MQLQQTEQYIQGSLGTSTQGPQKYPYCPCVGPPYCPSPTVLGCSMLKENPPGSSDPTGEELPAMSFVAHLPEHGEAHKGIHMDGFQ